MYNRKYYQKLAYSHQKFHKSDCKYLARLHTSCVWLQFSSSYFVLAPVWWSCWLVVLVVIGPASTECALMAGRQHKVAPVVLQVYKECVNLCQYHNANTSICKKDPSANKLDTFVFKLLYTTCFLAILLLFVYLANSI